MSDLTGRVVLAMRGAAYERFTIDDLAEAAIREVLAALREPSEAMALAYWARKEGARKDERAALVMADMLDAFAKEHGLERQP